jgi:hypothetical protein
MEENIMRNPAFTASIVAFALAAATHGVAQAAVSADEAAQLGKTLTPMGAEKAGNAAGTIPVWDGGLSKAPAGYKEGAHYPDPYAQDKPLFTIDASNAERYKTKLTPGQVAMLKRYPTWKMTVYPSRRSAAFPEAHYKETVANATKVKLAPGGNGIVGTTGGIPFPIPKSAQEVIWNHLVRYRGETYAMNWSQAAMTRDGAYTLVRFEYEYDFHYGSLLKGEKDREANKLFNFLQTVTAPARLAGQILLVHEYADQVTTPRQAWTYNPGQRRVRLAPNVAYDNPGTAADGLRTNDDFFMYNGATDRYEWRLLGKQEIYVPYNSYKLVGPTVKYADVLKPGHVNPEHARYELHRVWAVEANVRQGTTHLYKKRTFYIDEDSWAVLVSDKYDARDDLWRVSELHSINFYNVPMLYPSLEVHHDLQSGRYIAMGLRNEEPKVYERIQRRGADFQPASLRGVGTR